MKKMKHLLFLLFVLAAVGTNVYSIKLNLNTKECIMLDYQIPDVVDENPLEIQDWMVDETIWN